ncbi:ATP-binding cassette domain-containing protein [Sedimentitalea sp. JM2-8]|uniref:ATP-binding cassette domain-containing protein n=1 Tax=Sedimentitalea xiamensis TaxID=3050037 RepID=A0ABT7FKJ2_9RHOB|nr:ATP-binding cassette domain-containing protein [Sedimentitalea xiamensis]MDK3075651.1 ATP-binding cassette domain-containing protein [Sedimentitalea xiamensis]
MATEPSVLHLKQLDLEIGAESRRLKVEDLRIPRGRVSIILGPSGSGKTTLLSVLGGLLVAKDDHPSNWNYVPYETLAEAMDGSMRHLAFRNFGFVLQGNDLFRDASVTTNLEATMLAKGLQLDGPMASGIAEDLAALGFDPTQYVSGAREVWTFSGGERQAIATMREVASDPDVIFADEPGSNLDHDRRHALVDLLCTRMRKGRRTVVMVTHDPFIAGLFGDVFHVLDKTGQLIISAARESLDGPDGARQARAIATTAGFPERLFLDALAEGDRRADERTDDAPLTETDDADEKRFPVLRVRARLAVRLGRELALRPGGKIQVSGGPGPPQLSGDGPGPRMWMPRAAGLPCLAMMTIMTLAIFFGLLAHNEVSQRFELALSDPSVRHAVVYQKTSADNPRQKIDSDIVRQLDGKPWLGPKDAAPEIDSLSLMTNPCKGLQHVFPYNYEPQAKLAFSDQSRELDRAVGLLAGCYEDEMFTQMRLSGERPVLTRMKEGFDDFEILLNGESKLVVGLIDMIDKPLGFMVSPDNDPDASYAKITPEGGAVKQVSMLSTLPSPVWDEVSVLMPLKLYQQEVEIEATGQMLVDDTAYRYVPVYDGARLFFDPAERHQVFDYLKANFIANLSNFKLMNEMDQRMRELQRSISLTALGATGFSLLVIGFGVWSLVGGNAKAQLLMRLRGFGVAWIFLAYAVIFCIYGLLAFLFSVALLVPIYLMTPDWSLWSCNVLPEWLSGASCLCPAGDPGPLRDACVREATGPVLGHAGLLGLASLIPIAMGLLVVLAALAWSNSRGLALQLRKET